MMTQMILTDICNDFSAPYDLQDNAYVFLIKIRNFELLSTVFENKSLVQAIHSAIEQIKSAIHKNGYKFYPNITYNNGYIQCFLYEIKSQDITHISYIIYSTIQLYSRDSGNIHFECIITSSPWDSKTNTIQKLLCNLSTNNTNHYYIDQDEQIIDKITDRYHHLDIIKHAISHDTFSFAYQPIIERSSGIIAYYECLLRIRTQQNKIISAGPFIPIAEDAGLSCIIDHKVLSMALKELQAASNIQLSINISNIGLLDINLLNLAKEMLSNRAIAERLTIEITETSLNTDFERIKLFTNTMRSLGCKIAIDDFGSGFTSFKQLRNIDMDIIKIDGSFIKDIAYNQRNQHLVLALIDIAKQIGAKTVAEFVENGEIAKILLDAQIDYMQGNFFSPALNYRSWDKN